MAAPGTVSQDLWGQVAGLPGIRTLRSQRFRLLLGISLLLIGLSVRGLLLVRLAQDPAGEFGIDFGAYRSASLQMLHGNSPYAADMVSGPFAAQGVDRYLYPPPFAQLLTPIAVLPFAASASVWLLLQAVLLVAACWIAGSVAGARPSAERFVWTGVALLYFLPVFATLWQGNIEAPIALAIALLLAVPAAGGARERRFALWAGVGAAVVALTKLIPLALLPAAVVRSRSLAAGVAIGLFVVLVPSIVLAPAAWLDYGRVLPNLIAADVTYPNNISASMAAQVLGSPPAVVVAIRPATLGMGLLLIAASVVLARIRDRWATAVACAATGSLLVPGAVWYHYLTLLVPLAVFAWFKGGRVTRAGLIGSAVVLVLSAMPFVPLSAFAPLAAAAAGMFGLTIVLATALQRPLTLSGSAIRGAGDRAIMSRVVATDERRDQLVEPPA